MARAVTDRPERRRDVGRALLECIREKGYAATSLKEVADRAGMSPSHVSYYFDNKAAILEYVARRISDENLRALPDPRGPDGPQLIAALVHFCFGGARVDAPLLGVIGELAGLAVHDAVLHEIKADNTSAWRDYLVEVFNHPDLSPDGGAERAAWLTHSLLTGLSTNALFDRSLDISTARDLFAREIRRISGLSSVGAAVNA